MALIYCSTEYTFVSGACSGMWAHPQTQTGHEAGLAATGARSVQRDPCWVTV